MRDLKASEVADFQKKVWGYFKIHRRELPWRIPEANGTFDAYKIMVSELMLQQTQVPRVISKYEQFLHVFPSIKDLAQAELKDVLLAWSGLGYNRRAKFLWQAAQVVHAELQDTLPSSVDELIKLPGVGKNTAGAILAYAYNHPAVFIETNIRTVIIHHFFQDKTGVTDAEIVNIVTQTIPEQNAREWYWALMDYGTYIKARYGNANIQSKSYTTQTKFHGSTRQVRGLVLKILQPGPKTQVELQNIIKDERLKTVLFNLETEKLIHVEKGLYYLG